MAVDAGLAFNDAGADGSLAALQRQVDAAIARPELFYSPDAGRAYDFHYKGNLLTFSSAIATETAGNNLVRAQVHECRSRHGAVVILPHWNAPTWSYRKFAAYLSRLGLAAVELALPYHGPRNRPGANTSDYFLSANLGRTIRSVRQAVLDTRAVLDWLDRQGYQHIGLAGVSLGSCIAGLVAAHETRVRCSALLLTAGDFAEVVWTGQASQHVRRALEPSLTLEQLDGVWRIISTAAFARQLSRGTHSTLVLSGARDNVVKPYLTQRFVDELRACNATVQWTKLPCGHYSLALLPFNVMAAGAVLRFFFKSGLRP